MSKGPSRSPKLASSHPDAIAPKVLDGYDHRSFEADVVDASFASIMPTNSGSPFMGYPSFVIANHAAALPSEPRTAQSGDFTHKKDSDSVRSEPSSCVSALAPIPQALHLPAVFDSVDRRHATLNAEKMLDEGRTLGMPPPKAVCRDLLIGFKSMPYVMLYNHFAH